MQLLLLSEALVPETVATYFENAPIREALIDIRIEPTPSSRVNVLESLFESVKDQYPIKERTSYFEGEFSVGPQIGSSTSLKPSGFSFKSEDGQRVFQARVDGFTYSRLRPYGNWSELRDEARRLWLIYCATLGTVHKTRVALRYINQIDIPQPSIDYKDYFRTIPEVSPALPQSIEGFVMQLRFPLSEFDGHLNLIQASVSPPTDGFCSVVLDIDVFTNLESLFAAEIDLWALLERMRSVKNEFFFGSITDSTRALFGREKEA